MPAADPFTAPEYDRAALLTIDIQNDTLEGGPFAVAGTSAILAPTNRLCRAFRAAGRPIVHVIRIYTPDAADADRCRRRALLEGQAMLLKGTPGRRPADALMPGTDIPIDDDRLLDGSPQEIGPGEVILFKPRWGAFYRTSLERHLRGMGVSSVVVCGCNYPNCPRTSIYQASERDFRVAAVVDAMSGMQPADLAGLAAIGVACVTAGEVCRAVAQAGGGTL